MLHDGSWVRLRKIAEDYDPSDRARAYAYIRDRQRAGEVVTGLLYISEDSQDLHAQSVGFATIGLDASQLIDNLNLQERADLRDHAGFYIDDGSATGALDEPSLIQYLQNPDSLKQLIDGYRNWIDNPQAKGEEAQPST